jgi:hypothetical protein
MTHMSIDRSKWKPLLPSMQQAICDYDAWSRTHLLDADAKNKITTNLYQYTNAAGLKGIIESRALWFTSYAHLNDPGEITYGMTVTTELLKEIGERNDARIKLFCDMVIDLFTHDNMRTAFGFYIASFSRDGDDLGQWRAYGDNGRGYSLGCAPIVFEAIGELNDNPTENYVVLPVHYGEQEGRALLTPPITKALELVANVVVSENAAMRDGDVGMPFFDEMAKALIASELILHSMSIKHEAYRHENEVRLALVGQVSKLTPHVLTRTRNGEIVPYIKVSLPLQTEGKIAEVVVGPSAPVNSEDGVRALLPALEKVRRSTIPYRAG